jgi:hypothetical protein
MKKRGKPRFDAKPEFEEAARKKMSPFEIALAGHSISLETLAKQLAEELRATETKTFKSRGEPIKYSKPLRAWNIQQRAREDAQKLLGLYPAEEHRVFTDVFEHMSDEDRAFLRQVARQVGEKVKGRGKV